MKKSRCLTCKKIERNLGTTTFHLDRKKPCGYCASIMTFSPLKTLGSSDPEKGLELIFKAFFIFQKVQTRCRQGADTLSAPFFPGFSKAIAKGVDTADSIYILNIYKCLHLFVCTLAETRLFPGKKGADSLGREKMKKAPLDSIESGRNRVFESVCTLSAPVYTFFTPSRALF